MFVKPRSLATGVRDIAALNTLRLLTCGQLALRSWTLETQLRSIASTTELQSRLGDEHS
jgi:hypothetical protein